MPTIMKTQGVILRTITVKDAEIERKAIRNGKSAHGKKSDD